MSANSTVPIIWNPDSRAKADDELVLRLATLLVVGGTAVEPPSTRSNPPRVTGGAFWAGVNEHAKLMTRRLGASQRRKTSTRTRCLSPEPDFVAGKRAHGSKPSAGAKHDGCRIGVARPVLKRSFGGRQSISPSPADEDGLAGSPDRCPIALDVCRVRLPPAVSITEDHVAWCHAVAPTPSAMRQPAAG